MSCIVKRRFNFGRISSVISLCEQYYHYPLLLGAIFIDYIAFIPWLEWGMYVRSSLLHILVVNSSKMRHDLHDDISPMIQHNKILICSNPMTTINRIFQLLMQEIPLHHWCASFNDDINIESQIGIELNAFDGWLIPNTSAANVKEFSSINLPS